jgi:hypothetical protein
MAKNTTIEATLEQQVAADSDIPLDDQGLPDFETGARNREERLKALDARDDALNGHAQPRGVRPSEQCGVMAGSGPYAGRRCTYADHSSTEPHSWEVSSGAPDSEQPGHVYDDAEQPTLPGTPEPEQTEYTVPSESAFGKSGKLLPAPGLKAIAERLIDEDDNLEHLRGVEMRFAWRRRGGTTGGSPRYAHIKKPDDWSDYFTGGKVVFLVSLSADHIRAHHFTERQIEAALFDRLSRTERDPDNHDAYRVNGPDFAGNIATFDKYGDWEPSVREAHAHMLATPLEEAIDQADAEDRDDGEDDSE